MAHINTTFGGAESNSYVSIASALDYAEHNAFSGGWSAYSSAIREKSLITATALLDTWVDWYGSKVSDEDVQALRWPRYSVIDRDGYEFDSDKIPVWLKNATTEFAFIIGNGATDPFAAPDTAGFKRMKVGSLELEVDSIDRDAFAGLPDKVRAIVEPYGKVRNKGGSGTATLVRT